MMAMSGDVQEVLIAQLNGNQGRCIRVKVDNDFTKALPRGKRANTLDGKPLWVSFRYEKLLPMCHYCGMVGHDDKVCVEKYNDVHKGVVKENLYGAWLKASPTKATSCRRPEGRAESSLASSDSKGVGYGRSLIQGDDLHNPDNLWKSKYGKRRILWDSNQVAKNSRVLTEKQRVVKEKELARKEELAKAFVEERRLSLSSKAVERKQSKVEELATKPTGVINLSQSSPTQQDKVSGRGFRRITKANVAHMVMQEGNKENTGKSAKRKKNLELVGEKSDEDENQGNSKKQKTTCQDGDLSFAKAETTALLGVETSLIWSSTAP
ncbi:hypothetical protein Vadar_034373 [Vaccinium darrowii]|uniref:Uncharacterized protein n=1 Tax=Vaccinium darrowii TaxID=229202 RepID=A0ACB7ZGC4_9ERIC|nr:hypothetical protein Vadar_034373 [Vaccinium darrowii]